MPYSSIVVYLYSKLIFGKETDSTYQNNYYLFKKVANKLSEKGIHGATLNDVV